MRLSLTSFVTSWLVAAGTVLAWPGYSWDRWRAVSQATTRPAVTSPQAGEQELVELLRTAGPGSARITSLDQWQAKQVRIREVLQAFLGRPSNLTKPAPEAVVLDETAADGYVRRHIKIRCEPDDWVTAYLLLPKTLPSAPSPAVICLHQTVSQGKDEAAGIKGSPSMFIAHELAKRGYICLVPDVIGFGERLPEGATRRVASAASLPSEPLATSAAGAGTRPATRPAALAPYDGIMEFFQRHPRWSVMGKMNWDVSRCIDYLETVAAVDRRRIGCIGHSHGAYGTIFAMAFDPRIACGAASCGFTTLRTDPRPDRWCGLTPLMPAMGFYMPEDVRGIPFDWHEICSLLAPRPFLNWATLNDTIFPKTDNLAWVFGQLGEVYALYGAKDRLAWKTAAGEHRFPEEAREWAYRWLAEQLGNGAARGR